MSRVATISEAGSIAIHSMVLIARAHESLNAVQIAETTGSSRHHIAKILQRLVKEGFITSARGPKGGFELKQDASSVSLLDIYEAIEGKVEVSECPMEHAICPFDKCIMGGVITKMTTDFINYMSSQTLASYR
jgi:Rrf2 family protein